MDQSWVFFFVRMYLALKPELAQKSSNSRRVGEGVFYDRRAPPLSFSHRIMQKNKELRRESRSKRFTIREEIGEEIHGKRREEIQGYSVVF